jgi:hypothetical protein
MAVCGMGHEAIVYGVIIGASYHVGEEIEWTPTEQAVAVMFAESPEPVSAWTCSLREPGGSKLSGT